MTAQLSRERLEEIVNAAGLEPCDSDEVFDSIKHWEIVKMSRMLLAAMDSEPVGEVVLGDYDDCGDYPDAKVVCIAAQGQADWNNFRNGTKLYAAPPAPVAVPTFEEWCQRKEQKPVGWVREAMKEAYDGCRAAMLKARPVTAATVPEGWKLVPVQPTDDMCEAGFKATDKYPFERFDNYREIHRCWALPRYKAMLAAAPPAPEQE